MNTSSDFESKAAPTISYNALTELTKKNQTKVHRSFLEGHIEGTGDDAVMHIALPLKEIARSRPGTGQRHSLGFALTVDFSLPDGTPCQLYAPWVSLTAR